MPTQTVVVVDYKGKVLFSCTSCGRPLTHDDFFELGLRLPDDGESRDDYCESELLDVVRHPACPTAGAA